MPHLFVVIDEFGELLTAEPEFVDLFITIGRIGRSIGVHLLLSSQRIEGGKLRGLDTYLSYRIGLRTFSESESAVVLDTPDAFHLPAIPGYGYLKVDTSVYRASGRATSPGPCPVRSPPPADADAEPAAPLLLPTYNGLARPDAGEDAESELLATRRRPAAGRRVRRPRCRARAATTARSRPSGCRRCRRGWPWPGSLIRRRRTAGQRRAACVPIGLLDHPAKQQQAPWLLDLSRGGGHLAVIGAPQSGRTHASCARSRPRSPSPTPRER